MGSTEVQRRHEAPEVGAAIVRMMRALVARAAEGDWEAIEQLAMIEQLAPTATSLACKLAHDGDPGYSYTELANVLGVARQAVRQRVARAKLSTVLHGAGHVLVPGHNRRTCHTCNRDVAGLVEVL